MRHTPQYARELKPHLPAEAFQPVPARLLVLPLHLTVIVASMFAIVSGVAWPLVPLFSLLIGGSFASLMFLAHETMHGSVVKGRRLQQLIASVAFLPFALSPRLWAAWHNRVHHAHTNVAERDPDAYPTLEMYRKDPSVRIANALAPGGGSWLSLLLPIGIGFSIHSFHVLISAKRWGYLTTKQHCVALLHTALSIGLWLAVAWLVGPVYFLFIYVVPLLVANSIVMSFILTNHTLSPLVESDDALLSTLSVTLPRPLEWLTLGFGYHVEHHVFPAMSSRYAPAVKSLLVQHWPERYQSLPLLNALHALRGTGRVYKDANTLLDPPSGHEWPALKPRTT